MSIFDSYEKACQRTAENELAKCRYKQEGKDKVHARLRKLVRELINKEETGYWDNVDEIKSLSNWRESK